MSNTGRRNRLTEIGKNMKVSIFSQMKNLQDPEPITITTADPQTCTARSKRQRYQPKAHGYASSNRKQSDRFETISDPSSLPYTPLHLRLDTAVTPTDNPCLTIQDAAEIDPLPVPDFLRTSHLRQHSVFNCP